MTEEIAVYAEVVMARWACKSLGGCRSLRYDVIGSALRLLQGWECPLAAIAVGGLYTPDMLDSNVDGAIL
jgi:hypothetical protein